MFVCVFISVAKTIRNPVYPLLALTCLYQNQMHVVGRLQGKVTADVSNFSFVYAFLLLMCFKGIF